MSASPAYIIAQFWPLSTENLIISHVSCQSSLARRRGGKVYRRSAAGWLQPQVRHPPAQPSRPLPAAETSPTATYLHSRIAPAPNLHLGGLWPHLQPAVATFLAGNGRCPGAPGALTPLRERAATLGPDQPQHHRPPLSPDAETSASPWPQYDEARDLALRDGGRKAAKKAIPIRTFADWDDARPGFLELDLVAHCGETTSGDYLNTLDTVDIATCWSECLVPANRRQQAACIEVAREGAC
jgi:hypothetical protein